VQKESRCARPEELKENQRDRKRKRITDIINSATIW
jgi:hypothetical protein